jgi:hypothetical protein
MDAQEKIMKHLIAAVLLLAFGSVQATTIDFEEFAGLDHLDPLGTTFNTQGFTFSSVDAADQATQLLVLKDFQGHAGTAMAACPECTVTLSKSDGSLFDISSAVLAPNSGVIITGYFDDVDMIQTTISVQGWSNYEFTYEWTGLKKIEFSAPLPLVGFGTSFDNLVMTTPTLVPIPAAVWLFGSALGGLGWMRRRKIV